MGSSELGFKMEFRVAIFVLIVPVMFWIVLRWGLGPDENLIKLTTWWSAITAVIIMVTQILREREINRKFARKLLLWEAIREKNDGK